MIIPVQVKLNVSTTKEVYTLGVATKINVISGDPYQGEYVVTPTRETQVLNTQGYYMEGDVTVNPIPPEYGLVTWNGSYLMIS